MFQRPKKKRTKASFFPADGSQASMLQQICEKSLGDILCFFWPNTLSLHETINRSPICAAKVLQRLLCRWRFTLCLQHHGPVRGRKRDRPVLCASANHSSEAPQRQRRVRSRKSHAQIKAAMPVALSLFELSLNRETL